MHVVLGTIHSKYSLLEVMIFPLSALFSFFLCIFQHDSCAPVCTHCSRTRKSSFFCIKHFHDPLPHPFVLNEGCGPSRQPNVLFVALACSVSRCVCFVLLVCLCFLSPVCVFSPVLTCVSSLSCALTALASAMVTWYDIAAIALVIIAFLHHSRWSVSSIRCCFDYPSFCPNRVLKTLQSSSPCVPRRRTSSSASCCGRQTRRPPRSDVIVPPTCVALSSYQYPYIKRVFPHTAAWFYFALHLFSHLLVAVHYSCAQSTFLLYPRPHMMG